MLGKLCLCNNFRLLWGKESGQYIKLKPTVDLADVPLF